MNGKRVGHSPMPPASVDLFLSEIDGRGYWFPVGARTGVTRVDPKRCATSLNSHALTSRPSVLIAFVRMAERFVFM
jgi:hypothetical protein